MYKIAINPDRVHITKDGVPVETKLFNTYDNEDGDGAAIAIGLAVLKAIELNNGSVLVENK